MFDDEKDIRQNLKDTRKDPLTDNNIMPTIKRKSNTSYPKLNKLITALYIVTDVMDKDEPIRLKLRTFGIETLSDIQLVDFNHIGRIGHSESLINKKIQSILSLLEIALSIGLISEMNFNILKKEFVELSQAFQPKESYQADPVWLKEFLLQSPSPVKEDNKKNLVLSSSAAAQSSSNISRKQRRNDIIETIRLNGGNATITDIKTKASGELASCGEKTLQRELVSMVKDGMLSKTGEKRWSRYFLKDPAA